MKEIHSLKYYAAETKPCSSIWQLLLFSNLVFVIMCQICTPVTASSETSIIRTVPELGKSKQLPQTKLLKELLECYPSDSKAHIESNIARIGAAINSCGTNDPWAGKAFYDLAYSYYNLGELNLALSNVEAAIRLPDTGDGLRLSEQQLRMICLQCLGRDAEAVKVADELINTPGPNYLRSVLASRAYIQKAQMLEFMPKSAGGGSLASANEYKKYIIEADKHYAGDDWQKQEPYVMRGLGATLVASGEPKQAISWYGEFLRRYPKNYDAALIAMERLSLVDGSLMNVKSNEFMSICSQYPINTGPGQIVAYQLGMAYVEEDKPKIALPVFLQVYHYNPQPGELEYSEDNTAMAGYCAVICYDELGDKKARIQLARDIIKRFPKSISAKEIKVMLKTWEDEERAERISFIKIMLARIVPIVVAILLTSWFVWTRRKRFELQ